MTKPKIIDEFHKTLEGAEDIFEKDEIQALEDSPENIITAREQFEDDFKEEFPEDEYLANESPIFDDESYIFDDEP